jgi:hypothetical protein
MSGICHLHPVRPARPVGANRRLRLSRANATVSRLPPMFRKVRPDEILGETRQKRRILGTERNREHWSC